MSKYKKPRKTSKAPSARKIPKARTRQTTPPVRGTIQGHPNGFGFLVTAQGDYFVTAKNLHGALHGDTVVGTIRQGADRPEATVTRVLERGFDSIVGTYTSCGAYGFVSADQPKYSSDIYVDAATAQRARTGDKVVVELVGYPPEGPRGRIAEVLGRAGDPGLDVLCIIRSMGLVEEFAPNVIQLAQRTSAQPISAENRRDFRDQTIITIDGSDARDLDDAVTVARRGPHWALGVHIADVGHYVQAGNALDTEARKRGTSVYFCDRVLPMLPPVLSNGVCSLNEGVDRLTLSLEMLVDSTGNVVEHTLSEGIIRSRHRMTYDCVNQLLDGQVDERWADVVPMLHQMDQLAQVLTARRRARGSIDFDLPEARISLDDAGQVVDVVRRERGRSHRIIEELMLLANQTVAQHFCAQKLPFVFRVHERPSEDKLAPLMRFCAALGIPWDIDPESVTPGDIARLLDSVEPRFAQALSVIALRCMTKAAYSPTDSGHFGLAAQHYCHFTSPIRRYPDLWIHRAIKLWLAGQRSVLVGLAGDAAEAARQSSIRERLAEDAERKVDDLKKAQYMSQHIGEEFAGVVSGVIERGFFVRLDSTIEGFVRLPVTARYQPDTMRISQGERHWGLGDCVRVRVSSVAGDKIGFEALVD